MEKEIDLLEACEQARKTIIDEYHNALQEYKANSKKWDVKTREEKEEALNFYHNRYRFLLWVDSISEPDFNEDVEKGGNE